MKYLQGKFTPTNPEKYVGDITNIVYRSSWELKFLQYCDRNPDILQYGSEEIIIPYLHPVDKRIHRYFPDFVLKVKTKDQQIKTLLIEIKPEAQTKPPPMKKRSRQQIQEVVKYAINKSKWEAAQQFCKKNGWEFEILTERSLGIR